MFRHIARIISRHPITILVVTLAILVTAGVFGTGIFAHLSQGNYGANGTESARAGQILDDKFSHTNPDMIVLMSNKTDHKVGTKPFDSAAQKIIDKIGSINDVYSVSSYYSTRSSSFVSKDGDKTFITINFKEHADGSKLAHEIQDKLEAVDSPNIELGFAGSTVLENTFNTQIEHDLKRSEIMSFAILAVLLVVVFRSLVAALLPLLLGGFTILVSFLCIRLISNFTAISQYAINIIIALGLGLAIDYSLLIISRFREELSRQKGDKIKALQATVHTAGHTVFFSGLTVITCLLSLVIFPMDMLRSMGIGGAIAVAVAMISGLIVLPACLALLGKNINALAIGKLRKSHQSPAKPSTIWHHITDHTMKRPIIFTSITLLVLLAAGTPLLQYHASSISVKSLPKESSLRRTLDTLSDDFPKSSTTGLTIVYTTQQDFGSSSALADLGKFTDKLSKLPHVISVDSVANLPVTLNNQQLHQFISNPNTAPPTLKPLINNYLQGNTTVININRSSNITTQQRDQLLSQVRSTPAPPNVTVLVGGSDAIARDQIDAVKHTLPYAVLWIAGAIFIILFLMLDSVVLPIKAILLNTLSLSVALGGMVWIFQGGHLANIFGFNTEAGVGITQPIIVFVAAFGLSMDYSAFLYGRIKEEYDKSGDTKKAVAHGLAMTGGIITSAALLMFVVVAAFATSKVADIQQIGVGLSIAILVDAFIVRIILVPASMAILGKYNWWAPKFLKNLHRRLGLDKL